MKAPLLQLIFTALVFTGLISCSKEDSAEDNASELAGEYALVSMTSDIAVDLNNDGIASTNLLDELGPGVLNTGSPGLEIKPVLLDNELVQVMSFFLPHPKVDFNLPEPAVEYSIKGIGYQYEFNKQTNKITIDNGDDPIGTVTATGNLVNIEVAGEGALDAVIIKYYYDFATDTWILLTISCGYEQE